MPNQPDIVVVGGGVIGLTCAWRLAQAGMTVRVLERDAVGSGASGACLGALVPATATMHGPHQMLQRASLGMFPDFAAELRDAADIDIGYVRCGLLDILHNADRRRNAVKEAQGAVAEWPAVGDGPVMEILSNEEAVLLEPQARFDAEGVRHCRASAQVDVARLLEALRTACGRHGVAIREGAAVTGVDIHAGRVRGVLCGENHLAAGAVLVAAGAWTPALGPVVARHAPIQPVKGQALLLRTAGGLFTHIIKRRRAYVLPRRGGHVLVGSTTEPEAGFDRRNTAAGVAALTAGALDLVPALGEAALVRTWAGLRPESRTHRPVLGAIPEVDGLFVAAGHYKTGVATAPLTGQIMAQLIAGGRCIYDAAPFAPAAATVA